tara:strand:+ start:795 stop:1124 length:330 start_codon:yes stop_codon:yes gene_type:complete
VTHEADICQACQSREVEKLREDLRACRKEGQTKDRSIKVLNKRVFVLTCIAIGIAAIFGKEALDAITEWIGSIRSFNSSLSQSEVIVPAPGTLAVFALLPLMGRSRRRK